MVWIGKTSFVVRTAVHTHVLPHVKARVRTFLHASEHFSARALTMSTRVRTFVYVSKQVCTCQSISTRVQRFLYSWLCTCAHAWPSACSRRFSYPCPYTGPYTCPYICPCICQYTYLHTCLGLPTCLNACLAHVFTHVYAHVYTGSF